MWRDWHDSWFQPEVKPGDNLRPLSDRLEQGKQLWLSWCAARCDCGIDYGGWLADNSSNIWITCNLEWYCRVLDMNHQKPSLVISRQRMKAKANHYRPLYRMAFTRWLPIWKWVYILWELTIARALLVDPKILIWMKRSSVDTRWSWFKSHEEFDERAD